MRLWITHLSRCLYGSQQKFVRSYFGRNISYGMRSCWSVLEEKFEVQGQGRLMPGQATLYSLIYKCKAERT